MTLNTPMRTLGTMLAVLGLLAGCGIWGDDEERLEGERIKIRDQRAQAGQTFAGNVPPLPEAREIGAWSQTNGTPSHAAGNLFGPSNPSRVWTADAGAGNADGITGAPIIVAGRVYVLDAAAQVSAFDASTGSVAWRTDLAPEGEDGADGFGGGLAAAGELVFATTGFGEVVALDINTGEIIWRYKATAPFRAAPAIERDVVVAVTRDNRALAINANAGSLIWRIDGISSEAGLLGGASPAIQGRLAVLPFGSGEVVGADVVSGRQAWSAVLGGARRGVARAAIADVTGDPVIVGRIVIAANQSGRIVAIDGRTGRRGWTRSVGSTGPIWAAGDSIYLVTDDSALVRMTIQGGQTIWRQPLPAFEDEEDREDPIAYSGPVLISGQLWITSSRGEMLAFDAANGEARGVIDIAAGTTTGVAMAGRTMYVLSEGGTLEAFR